MASSGKNMNSDLGRKKKSDLLKEYMKAQKMMEELEGELRQAKQEVEEMKEENETIRTKMEAAGENAKKQIQDAEKERVNLRKRIEDLEETVHQLQMLLMKSKRHEEAALKLFPSVTDIGKPTLLTSKTSGISEDPRVVDLRIFSPGLKSPTKVIPHDQPFEMQMIFDFTGVKLLPMECDVIVYARPVAGPLKHRQILVESPRNNISTDKYEISFTAASPPKGYYRLEIELSLHKPGSEEVPAPAPLPAFLLKGGRVHVY